MMASNDIVTPQVWTTVKPLGIGKYGDISLCQDSNERFLFVRKEFKNVSKKAVKAVENELKILSKIQHERIVQYYGSRQEKGVLSIFLEYMSAGSVFDNMKNSKQPYNEKATAKATRQTLEGLEYLHSEEIIHLNIKAANILLDTKGNFKLADFGISKCLSETSSGDGPIAPLEETAYWMAPEVINNESYDNTADLWSLGCTVVEMMTRKPPFKIHPISVAIQKIGNGEKPTYELPKGSSENIKRFLEITLQKTSVARTSATALLEQPFVKM